MKAASLALALSASVLLVSCDDDDTGAAGAETVYKIADAQIRSYTDDTSLPLDINALPITGADTNDTSLPRSVD